MTTTEIITAILALYGAVLATFTFVVQQLEKRKKIVATLSLGFAACGRSSPVDVVTFEAANAGDVPVHVSSCHLFLPETKEKLVAAFQFNRDFPVTLNPGESVQAWLESEKFIEIVRKTKTVSELLVVAEFSNKGGSTFRSKPERFNLEKMLFAKQNAA
jgi:hypothetical protein